MLLVLSIISGLYRPEQLRDMLCHLRGLPESN